MLLDDRRLVKLRTIITENLRIQRGNDERLVFIDPGNVLTDVRARQNHAIFARRGCGKTLLLHSSARMLDPSIKAVYLNCEDYKRHSFPNVLIEILDALFSELEKHLTGWFGRGKQSRRLIEGIRAELAQKRSEADKTAEAVKHTRAAESTASQGVQLGAKSGGAASVQVKADLADHEKEEVERTFQVQGDKLQDLDMWLPRLKQQLRDFFAISSSVKAVFLQIDDFYLLRRADQPFVVDYVHRLCKDVPIFFKIATLRHASVLYLDREGQPFGAQERHDYQPINIDYNLADFRRTREQNLQILREFAELAGISPSTEVDTLFKGEGFDRLVMAGGGVPRDTLSLFLEMLRTVQAEGGDRIGKDDVRILSKSNFERRVEELKADSEGRDQDTLMKGIYVLREFCLSKQSNVFVISERLLQQRDEIRSVVYRLLDYRIIHNTGSALTHKSQAGTFQAFAIDIGSYAHLRKLEGRFNELDIAAPDAKERMRSAPILEEKDFDNLWVKAPDKVTTEVLGSEESSDPPSGTT
jgi:hypothetical protein